jgi:hypothetical protein
MTQKIEYRLTCSDIAAIQGYWQNCSIPDCPNKVCLHLQSNKCWPHTVGLSVNWHKGLSQKQIELKNREMEEAYFKRLEQENL